MIKVDIKLSSKGERTDNHEVSVVADILRASTVITTLFHYGIEYIIPTTFVRMAFKLAEEHNALIAGERKSLKVKGFDYGNSPTEFSPGKFRGKRIIFSSTNFPKAISRTKKSPIVLVSSILNVGSVIKIAYELAIKNKLNICLMLAGSKRDNSDEDIAFAGIAGMILQRKRKVEISDKVEDAIDFVRGKGLERCIKDSAHGKELLELGFKDDVEFACKKNLFSDVPIIKDNKIIKLQ